MKWQPVPDTEPESTDAPGPMCPRRLQHIITHGIHTFCMNDVHISHLACFLAMLAGVLFIRWWKLNPSERRVKRME
jgi:hypothetical protein